MRHTSSWFGQLLPRRKRSGGAADQTEAASDAEVVRLSPVGRGRLPERRSLQDPLLGKLNLVIQPPAASGAIVSETSALGVAAVAACVSLLADMVAKLPIELFQRTPNGPKPITRHPALDVVNRPSDMHGSFELRQLMMTGKGLGGNGYARVFRDSMFKPVALEWLRPCDVEPEKIKRANGNSMVAYKTADGETLTSSDVIHLKWLSIDGIKGMSPVTMLRESIGTSLSQTQAAGRLMRNGTTFPGYLTSTQTLAPDKLKDAREEWDRHHSGAMNAGRVPILNGTFQFQQVNGMSMSDAEFIESRRFELQEVARHYRIPLHLLSDSSGTTWGTNIEQNTLGFLNFCLDPHLVAFEEALQNVLLTSAEIARGYYFRFDRDELASVSRQDTASYFQTMRSIGVYSVNDIRRKLDEPVITPEQGGDDYSLPFNNTGGAAKAKEESKPAEPAPAEPATT